MQAPGPPLYTLSGERVAELRPKLDPFTLKKNYLSRVGKRCVDNILFSNVCVIYLHTCLAVKAFFGRHWENTLFNLNKRLAQTFVLFCFVLVFLLRGTSFW